MVFQQTDRGYKGLKAEAALKQVEVQMPLNKPRLKAGEKESQRKAMPPESVEHTRAVAGTRIHDEREMKRVKDYSFLRREWFVCACVC